MSKIKFSGLDAQSDWLFDASDASLIKATTTVVTYKDNDTGHRWIVTGDGLQTDAEGTLVAGIVVGMETADRQGSPFFIAVDFVYQIEGGKPLFETLSALQYRITELDDRLKGSRRDDYMDAGQGDDTLLGRTGDDSLNGRDGDDLIRGGGGDDFLAGGRGNDTLLGGKGNDQFQFLYGDGVDTIRDFDPAHDRIFADWDGIKTIYSVNGSAFISWGDGDGLVLLNVPTDAVSQDLFV